MPDEVPTIREVAALYPYGQDYNERAFATAASDMLDLRLARRGA